MIKNISIYSIGNIIPQAAGFILLPLYSRFLTPDDFGIVSSMQILCTIFAVFFTLAIERSIVRLYWDWKTEIEKKEYLGVISISMVAMAALIMTLTFFFQGFIGLIYKSIPFYPFYVYAILITYFSIFAYVPKTYLQLNQKAGSYVTISIIQFVFNVSFSLWFVIGLEEGANGMLKGQMIGAGMLAPVFIYMNLKIIRIKFNTAIFIESLKFSFPMIPGLLSAWILNMSDRIFLERYYSLADVGIYSIAYRISSLVIIIAGAFFMAYSPIFYNLASSVDQNRAKNSLFLYNSIFVIVILLICFALALFSKEAIVLLLDAKYVDAYKLVPIMCLTFFISQSTGLLNLSIYQEKKTIALMFIMLLGAVFNIFTNFLLIPYYGPYGAALSSLVTFTFIFIIEYHYAKKCYFIDYDWGKIIIGLLVALPIVLIMHFSQINIYISLLIKIMIMGFVMLFLYKHFIHGLGKDKIELTYE